MDPSGIQNYQIFIKSPACNQTLQNPNPRLTLSDVKSLLFPLASAQIFFTLNGKLLPEDTQLSKTQIPHLSTLTLHLRIPGGGGDGGATGAESRDCYLNMYAVKKPDKVDPNEVRLSKWLNCALSNEPLKHPVVVDKLGNLFNKEALVQALLLKKLPKQFGYIKGLKDMVSVELAKIPGSDENAAVKYQCPVTGLELNGKYKFFSLRGCGHVLSAKALKEVKSAACLVCHKEFEEKDKIVINGSEEEVKALRERMEEERAKAKEGGNGVSVKKGKRVKNDGEVGEENGKKHGLENNGKRLKAGIVAPANATKEVYASIFTSSKKSDFKETYSCRSLPLGRN